MLHVVDEYSSKALRVLAIATRTFGASRLPEWRPTWTGNAAIAKVVEKLLQLVHFITQVIFTLIRNVCRAGLRFDSSSTRLAPSCFLIKPPLCPVADGDGQPRLELE